MATVDHAQAAIDLVGLLVLARPPIAPFLAHDRSKELGDGVEDEAHALQYAGQRILPKSRNRQLLDLPLSECDVLPAKLVREWATSGRMRREQRDERPCLSTLGEAPAP